MSGGPTAEAFAQNEPSEPVFEEWVMIFQIERARGRVPEQSAWVCAVGPGGVAFLPQASPRFLLLVRCVSNTAYF